MVLTATVWALANVVMTSVVYQIAYKQGRKHERMLWEDKMAFLQVLLMVRIKKEHQTVLNLIRIRGTEGAIQQLEAWGLKPLAGHTVEGAQCPGMWR